LLLTAGGFYGEIILDLIKRHDSMKTEIVRIKENSRSLLSIVKGKVVFFQEKDPNHKYRSERDHQNIQKNCAKFFVYVVMAGILSA